MNAPTVTKRGVSLQTTGVLQAYGKVMTTLKLHHLKLTFIISTSFIILAGLKKCIPTTLLLLFFTADEIAVMEKDQVFVAITASAVTTSSI
jgi:hypothetical protein